MFRLVTQGCEKPSFLLVCDNIECAITMSAEAVTSELNPVTIPQQEAAFLEQCKKSGWLLSMRICLCPGHHEQVQQMAAQRRAQLVAAGAPAPGAHGGAAFAAE